MSKRQYRVGPGGKENATDGADQNREPNKIEQKVSPVKEISDIIRSPFEVFAISLVLSWLSAWSGAFLFRKLRTLKDDEREDFGTVQTATLTLLALIIGFSFSMATNRYDLRKNYEEAEANAIGTEYVRADLLPPPMVRRCVSC